MRRTARQVGLWSHTTWAQFVVETYLPAKHDQDGISCKCEKMLIAAGLKKAPAPKPPAPSGAGILPASENPNAGGTPAPQPAPKPKPTNIQAEMIDRYASSDVLDLLDHGKWKELLKKYKAKAKK